MRLQLIKIWGKKIATEILVSNAVKINENLENKLATEIANYNGGCKNKNLRIII